MISINFVFKLSKATMNKGVLLLLAAVLLCSCSEKKSSGVKAPTRVVTVIASAQSCENGPTYVGIVEEQESTAVSFTGMGVVQRVMVGEGQAVSRGQLIAVMDDTQARNVLRGAEAQMAQANDALQRFQMLHDNGSLPEVQWVEIQSKVAQAKAQLEVAKKNLADCRLVAPVSGIIGNKAVKAGETALPSQAVVTILNINTVKIKVSVPESEVNDIKANTPSEIKVEAVGRTLTGGRIEKGVQADPLTHTYDVRVTVANSDHKLLPGMVANVDFGLADSEAGMRVPVAAVQRNADGNLFVWTVGNDSTAHRTVVSVGSTRGNSITIAGGITEGQRIVTEGYQRLSEGTKVVY